MQFIIISGLSGAGKSRAASDLEDLGFYCVDNMPAEMIPQFASFFMAGSFPRRPRPRCQASHPPESVSPAGSAGR